MSATPLGNIDPNRQDEGPSTASGPSNTLSPLSKDKTALRQWTFPRAGGSNGSHVPNSHGVNSAVDADHGRSSSTSHTKPRDRTSSSANSKDLRHRTNASVFNAHTPCVSLTARPLLASSSSAQPVTTPSSISNKPAAVAKLVYSNVRRRSLGDIVWMILFGGCMIVFSSALMGFGSADAVHSLAVQSRVTKEAVASPVVVSMTKEQQQGEDRTKALEIEIPEAFLPSRSTDDKIPGDIHQPHGDSSHDQGEDLLADSPEDPALDDENAHDHPSSAPDALFSAESHDSEHPDHHHDVSHPSADESEEEDEANEALPEADELEDTSHIAEEEDVDGEGDDDPLGLHAANEGDGEGELSMPSDEDDAEEDEEEEESELISVDDVPPGAGDPDLVPANSPDSESELANPGDAYRRPAGREGLEAMRKEREALGRGRQVWNAEGRQRGREGPRRLRE